MSDAQPPRRETLLVFLRHPSPGAVKTRLIPALGPDGAARLYRRIADRVLGEARGLHRADLRRIAWAAPAEQIAAMRTWVGPEFECRAQAQGDLGRRLSTAFGAAFAEGAQSVVAIGTDCPWVTARLLADAFDALRAHDAVLGPALDGGYYLLGLARLLPVFESIPWSTPETAAVTLARLAKSGARTRELPPLRDIDSPADLAALAEEWPDWLAQ